MSFMELQVNMVMDMDKDEDRGQLGAWHVLAGMGLFDVQGGVQISQLSK